MSAEQQLLSQIIEKAWNDPVFKQKLLSDPKAALLESFNITVPSDIELHALEETPNKFYIVIPPAPQANAAGDESLAMW
ncbi:NHLP leader peptide family RiPP precursor [Paenibacillus sp. sptzw28]|uniref:NHLP leader peptide family RiPP precursor n=1 Tax=Paenibacillus sp. sptzw28 TaxID=715179 RepID=UPI001C6E0EC0|nr:NHLP leader peptide family RiPP precursor [Paenibacillus sp. sptzw28]QYR20877.1 NHLP leader peptide family RiPP precursor [Paenibacillus sp. sptzw28]